MNETSRKALLKIARETVEAVIRGEPVPMYQVSNPDLLVQQGAFVTLKKHGQLRGCIGRFTSNEPLYRTVQQMAIASATEDMRFVFNRIQPEELPEIDVEVSVLSPMEKTDDPLSLELGKHGIYIKRGFQSGCFLPQVATETGWDKETFLSRCCGGKAGLPEEAWKDPETEVYLFTAEVFGEKDEGGSGSAQS